MCVKKTVLYVLVATVAAAFAGPFGLEMGMTLEEVQQACGGRAPEYISDIRYQIEPVKKHPSFSTYIAWIDPINGLCFIRANSEEIDSNNTGDQVKNEFYKVEAALSKLYGKGRLTNELTRDCVFTDEGYWFYTLRSGERKLEAQWFPKKSDICWIDLFATAVSFKGAIISLQYEFTNYEKAREEQDSVL